MRERRVVTPDGHVWLVRRRWAKRRPPWRRRGQAAYELGPVERDRVPVLPDGEELAASFAEALAIDRDMDVGGGLIIAAALLAVPLLVVGGLVWAAHAWLLPVLATHAVVVAAAGGAVVAVVLVDRFTRPWFVEAELARMVDPPRRVWRVQGWRRSRHAVRAVAAAIADGRIGTEHGTVVFADPLREP